MPENIPFTYLLDFLIELEKSKKRERKLEKALLVHYFIGVAFCLIYLYLIIELYSLICIIGYEVPVSKIPTYNDPPPLIEYDADSNEIEFINTLRYEGWGPV